MSVNPRKVYQDTRNTSSQWRQGNRIFHPLTETQFRNKFKVGDRVTIRLINPNRKIYISAKIKSILTYNLSMGILGPYNIDSKFNNIPFTHVLVLDP